MRAAWNVITVLALANLIGIGGLVWWLHFSGRLDGDRVEAIRGMLSETLAEERARLAEEEAEAEAERESQAEVRLMSTPPVTASEELSLRLTASDIDREKIERLKREVEDLTATLSRERRALDRERAEFEAERAAFLAMRERLEAIEGDEQFAKSVGVLETMKAEDATAMLLELVQTDREQVVSYLDAMDGRARTKIMAQLVGDGQAGLAAELLEEIRVRGLEAVGE